MPPDLATKRKRAATDSGDTLSAGEAQPAVGDDSPSLAGEQRPRGRRGSKVSAEEEAAATAEDEGQHDRTAAVGNEGERAAVAARKPAKRRRAL